MENVIQDVSEKKRKSVLRRPWMWPLLPFLAVKWMIFGGWKWTWDEFLIHLACQVDKDEDGNPSIIYFVTFCDLVHFHPMVWGGFGLAAYLASAGQQAADLVGLLYVALFCWCGLTVTVNLPFRRLVRVITVIALIVGADFGLSVAAERLDATLVAANWPRLAFWAEQGALRPIRDFITQLDTGASVGFLVIFSIIWSVVVGYFVVYAILFKRFGFDGEHLIHWELGESQRMTPVYYQGSVLRQRDILEGIFGFSSMSIGTGKGSESISLDNIPFMALPGRQAQVSHIIARKAVDPTEVTNGGTSGNPGALRNPRRIPDDAGDAGAGG